jgi:methyl-accepting chemotaxis protein
VLNQILEENNLTKSTTELIEEYYGVIRANGKDQALQDRYEARKYEINQSLLNLNKTIDNKDSRVIFRGLENIIGGIISSCDQGLIDMSNNDLLSASRRYDEMLDNAVFVKDNIALLMREELSHYNKIEAEIDREHFVIIVASIIVFITVLILCIIYGFRTAKEITFPIKKLDEMTKAVSAGNLQVEINKSYFHNQSHEVKSLAESFNKMIVALRDKMQEISETNISIVENQAQMEKQNTELKRFNDLLVDRELKMVELKEEIERLKNEK